MTPLQFVGLLAVVLGLLLFRIAHALSSGIHPLVPEAPRVHPRIARRVMGVGAGVGLFGAFAAIAAAPADALLTAGVCALLLAVFVLRPLLIAAYYERRVSLRVAVYGSAALYAGPFVLIPLVAAHGDVSGTLLLVLPLGLVTFLVAAVAADLILRALADDRPPRDTP